MLFKSEMQICVRKYTNIQKCKYLHIFSVWVKMERTYMQSVQRKQMGGSPTDNVNLNNLNEIYLFVRLFVID